MIRGIYTNAAGLATATLRLGVVSNNLANASIAGYKQDRLPEEVGKPIDLARWAVDAQGRPIGTIVLGPKVGVSQLDLTPGPIQETSNPLDLAMGATASLLSWPPMAPHAIRATEVSTPTSTERCAPGMGRPFSTPMASPWSCQSEPMFP